METTTMAEKNLHDIKIDELDSPKKTPLKSILTLLALLFIILVISVVITRLILSTDGTKEGEENITPTGLASEVQADKNETLASGLSNGTKAALAAAATTAVVATTTKKVPVISNILERNSSSRTKTPLRTHEPVKPTKEVKKLVTETYKTPKHSSSSRHTTVTKKHTSTTKHSSIPKREYADRVVVKKHTTKKSTTHSSSYLGGKQKKLTRSYYIQVGSYKNTKTIISKIKKQNFNYALQKVEGNANLTRVFVGPFSSSAQAAKNLSKVKSRILEGAYVKKVTP